VFCSVRRKEEFIAQYTQNQSLWGCAFVGDEKRDVRAMQMVGHSYCPSDAQPPALRASLNILHRSGGSGILVEVEKDIQRRNRTISERKSDVAVVYGAKRDT
ncbi:MAG: hypothetical protein VX278_13405, partial [Myxococcota bacterium]|nr:hypothetical protein [Myxococcota bacterium]